MAVLILDQMKVLDQQIAPARPLAQQRAHVRQCAGVHLAALGGPPRSPPAAVLAGF
jgi:hypothetical protein